MNTFLIYCHYNFQITTATKHFTTENKTAGDQVCKKTLVIIHAMQVYYSPVTSQIVVKVG
jgi:hypothetical protein